MNNRKYDSERYLNTNIEREKMYFNIFKLLPIIFFVITIIAGLISGIVTSNIEFTEKRTTLYGVFLTKTKFGNFLIIQIISIIGATINYFLLKIFLSVPILQTSFLHSIDKSLLNESIEQSNSEKTKETKPTGTFKNIQEYYNQKNNKN